MRRRKVTFFTFYVLPFTSYVPPFPSRNSIVTMPPFAGGLNVGYGKNKRETLAYD